MKPPVSRQSNIELLRLLAMLFILLMHLFVAIGGVGSSIAVSILESFFIVAVNIFVLVSGYFGLQLTVRRLLNLYVTVLFYHFSLTLLGQWQQDSFQLLALLKTLLLFVHSPYWFINSYFMLLFCSPLLNLFIKKVSQQELQHSIAMLAFISCGLGFFLQGGINLNGYNVTQFIFLYFIGRYIRLYSLPIKLKQHTLLFCYLGCSLLLTTLLLVSPLNLWWLLAYNNPIVIVSSVALFLFFCSFRLENRFINSCSSSALAIYLIHQHPTIFPLYKSTALALAGYWYSPLLWLGYVLAVLIASILIDKGRLLLFGLLANIKRCL